MRQPQLCRLASSSRATVSAETPTASSAPTSLAAEASEAEAIEAYLPSELGDAELSVLVADAIAATGATSPRDMGRVIKQVMEAAGGRADGKRVSTKVKEALN